jgi:hypothetical protein
MWLQIFETGTGYDLFDHSTNEWYRGVPESELVDTIDALGYDPSSLYSEWRLPEAYREGSILFLEEFVRRMQIAQERRWGIQESREWLVAHLIPSDKPLRWHSPYGLKHLSTRWHIYERDFIELLRERGMWRDGKVYARFKRHVPAELHKIRNWNPDKPW